jgi:hypothetical protein
MRDDIVKFNFMKGLYFVKLNFMKNITFLTLLFYLLILLEEGHCIFEQSRTIKIKGKNDG